MMMWQGEMVLAILLQFFIGVTYCVQIRLLDVPEMAQAGHNVHLTCDYDLERQRLYQVKWYKGSHEFYRYSPSEEQKTKLFLVENLRVDAKHSDEKTVVLKNLHVDMTGVYSCEVSTEGIFETVKKSAKMTVIALPRGGPHIQGIQDRKNDLKIGDVITVNCTSLQSKPAADLTFFINGRNASEMKKVLLQRYLIVNEERRPQRESAILSMTFKVRRHHVKEARIQIKCEASILNIYKRHRLEELFVQTHTAENLAEPKNHYNSLAPNNTVNIYCTVVFIVCQILATTK